MVAVPSACTVTEPNSPAAARRDLDVHADPDAELHPVARLPAGRPAPRAAVVAGDLQGLPQRQVVVADVVGDAGQRAEREALRVEQVAPADLDGVQAQLRRGQVHHPLEVRRGLGPPGAAEGAHRCGVGQHRRRVVGDRRDVVGALRHHEGGAQGQGTAETRVGAGVAQHAGPQAGDAAVAPQAQLVPGHLAAPVRHRHEVLRAGVDPPRRSAQGAGDPDRDGVLGEHTGLAAERRRRRAGRSTRTCSSVRSNSRGGLAAEAVRHLGGDPDRRDRRIAAVVAGRAHRDGVALHRHHRDPLVDQARPDDDVRAVQRVGPVGARAGRRRRSSRRSGNCSGAPGATASSTSTAAGSGCSRPPRGPRRRRRPPRSRRRPRRRPRRRTAPGRSPAVAAAPGGSRRTSRGGREGRGPRR